jgi:hypothetical protein
VAETPALPRTLIQTRPWFLTDEVDEMERVEARIAALRDYGSLVLLFLDTEDGRVIPVPMARRTFLHLLAAQKCSSAELVGRSVTFDGVLMAFVGRGSER